MKKLSSKMKEMLLFIDNTYALSDDCRGQRVLNLLLSSVTGEILCGRPYEYHNLVTHIALLQRGLIHEEDNAFHTTTLTDAGREAVKRIRELDCNG